MASTTGYERLDKAGKAAKKKKQRLKEKAAAKKALDEQKGLKMTPKQLRTRARRAARKAEVAAELAYKPIEEWDDEELAWGRQRGEMGTFRGPSPQWITREIHEEAVRRFVDRARSQSRAMVPKALDTIEKILDADGLDKKGRPLVPAGVRLDAAKWLVEHVIGKPTQRTEMDISVRLQAVLAGVMVNPGDAVSAVNGSQGLEALMGGVNADGASSDGSGSSGVIGLADGMSYMPATVRADMWEDDDDEVPAKGDGGEG